MDFLAGCLGGCAGVFVGHPFDTVKVRLQVQCMKNPTYTGTYDCLRKIVQMEGLTGLYKGVTSPLYSLAAINAIVFGVQSNMLRCMTDQDALSSHFVAGAGAGFVQSFVCGPMELAKTRMQIQGEGKRVKVKGEFQHTSVFNCLKTMYKFGGVKAISRGMSSTICREVPAFGSYFLTYAYLTREFTPENEENCPTAGLLVAGGMAGCAAWLITYPVDVIKTRMQGDGVITKNGILYQYNSYSHCLKHSVQTDGIRVLSKGLNATLIRAFPVNAATFTVYEWVIRLLKKPSCLPEEGAVPGSAVSAHERTRTMEGIGSTATLD